MARTIGSITIPFYRSIRTLLFAGKPDVLIHYDHVCENGVKISDLNEGINAGLHAGGLGFFSASWHVFEAQPRKMLPMPLNEALVLAEKNLRSPTWLLSAELVYSNVTNAETAGGKYDLHWLLITPHWAYYINCVTGARWADHNEPLQ